jgi:hypothetical protein
MASNDVPRGALSKWPSRVAAARLSNTGHNGVKRSRKLARTMRQIGYGLLERPCNDGRRKMRHESQWLAFNINGGAQV